MKRIVPTHLHGEDGGTRWLPSLPELRRVCKSSGHWLRLRFELRHDLPLFISRECDEGARADLHRRYRPTAHEVFVYCPIYLDDVDLPCGRQEPIDRDNLPYRVTCTQEGRITFH